MCVSNDVESELLIPAHGVQKLHLILIQGLLVLGKLGGDQILPEYGASVLQVDFHHSFPLQVWVQFVELHDHVKQSVVGCHVHVLRLQHILERQVNFDDHQFLIGSQQFEVRCLDYTIGHLLLLDLPLTLALSLHVEVLNCQFKVESTLL